MARRPTAGAAGGSGPVIVEVGGRRLSLTNLDKILYPEVGGTKAQVVDYYARIAPVMLPHLAGRALTLVRFPNGVEGESFFEKRCPPHHPAWVDVGGELGQCVIDDAAGLVWLANLAALELHALQTPADEPDRPTAVVFDLDPGPPAAVLDAARIALELRAVLSALGLTAVVKTSGSKGVHLSVPLHTQVTADETKAFAHALGRLLEQRDPSRVTTEMRRAGRAGRVFVDWSQNDRHKTTVAPYSLRARPRPTVSTPVSWEEIEQAAGGDDVGALAFEADAVLARVERVGDLYEPNLSLVQSLPARTPD